MEEFIKRLADRLGPNTNALLGVGALAIVVIPYLIKAWESWADSRSGARAAVKERARLELLKLWLEVEALKKEHHLEPPFPLQPPLAATTIPSLTDRVDAILGQAASSGAESIRRPGVWRWIAALDRRHHRLSTSALALLAAIALPTAIIGIPVVIIGFQVAHGLDYVFAIIVLVLELLLLLFLRTLYRQYKLLRITRRHAQAPPHGDTTT